MFYDTLFPQRRQKRSSKCVQVAMRMSSIPPLPSLFRLCFLQTVRKYNPLKSPNSPRDNHSTNHPQKAKPESSPNTIKVGENGYGNVVLPRRKPKSGTSLPLLHVHQGRISSDDETQEECPVQSFHDAEEPHGLNSLKERQTPILSNDKVAWNAFVSGREAAKV